MKQRWRTIATGVIATLGIGLAALVATGHASGSTWTASTTQREGDGTDQLTAHEQSRARGLAMTQEEDSSGAERPEPDLEYLYAERHETAATAGATTGDEPRRADVYLYDYQRDRAVLRVVNLETDEVESTERFAAQPPISADEAVRATELVLADEDLGHRLRRDFESVTGERLTSADQLHSRAVRFRAAQAVGATNERDFEECGANRCAQLFIRFPNGKWIDTSRIVVDLSAERVRLLDS